jgi:hypothetical protein
MGGLRDPGVILLSRNLTDLTMAQKPKPPKKKNGTPPPIDKLIVPAIGVALALLAYYFFQGINSEVCISSYYWIDLYSRFNRRLFLIILLLFSFTDPSRRCP